MVVSVLWDCEGSQLRLQVDFLGACPHDESRTNWNLNIYANFSHFLHSLLAKKKKQIGSGIRIHTCVWFVHPKAKVYLRSLPGVSVNLVWFWLELDDLVDWQLRISLIRFWN